MLTDSKTETDTERLQETDDEGIERDSGEMDIDEFVTEETDSSYEGNSSTCSLKHVLNVSLYICLFISKIYAHL